MKKLVVSIMLVNLLAACAGEKPLLESETPTPQSTREDSESAPASATEVEVDPLNDSRNILAKRSVYYPFDVSAVQDEDKPLVQAHAKYLRDHADRRVRLEGNADERGSNEYNLALGQRRAEGVKKMLMLGGAKASQLETVSYGEEKPKASGHNESAWSQNRRTDIKY